MKSIKTYLSDLLTNSLSRLYPTLENPAQYAEIVLPKHAAMGDFAASAPLRLAKVVGSNPLSIAESVATELAKHPSFAEVTAAAPGFVNMRLTDDCISSLLYETSIAEPLELGAEKKILLEYCSLNVAKPMNIGHLRNTVFGECMKRLLIAGGYNVTTINHIGDWGTQFGKLILAIDLHDNMDEIKADPMGMFTKLYVEFHEKAETSPELEDQAREIFQRLEQGDAEIRAKWQWIVDINKIYVDQTLSDIGVHFDLEIGESFYIEQSFEMVKRLEKAGIAERNEDGSLAVHFEKFGFDLPSVLLQKKDGSTLYLTRDIATVDYRVRTYAPETIIYVVADEQSLHFRQLFALAKIAGIAGGEGQTKLVHMNYGLFTLKEGKMSTRKGRVINARDLLDEALLRAGKVLEEKGVLSQEDIDAPQLQRAIAYGAVFYSDLSQNRSTPQLFDWDKILSFEGNSAPYLQYVHARAASLLRKALAAGNSPEMEAFKKAPAGLTSDEHELLLKLVQYSDALAASLTDYRQNYFAQYVYELAAAFNSFYAKVRILDTEDEELRTYRIALVARAKETMARGLALMNIDAPERM